MNFAPVLAMSFGSAVGGALAIAALIVMLCIFMVGMAPEVVINHSIRRRWFKSEIEANEAIAARERSELAYHPLREEYTLGEIAMQPLRAEQMKWSAINHRSEAINREKLAQEHFGGGIPAPAPVAPVAIDYDAELRAAMGLPPAPPSRGELGPG